MLSRLFPRQMDNDYRGLTSALWLMVALLLGQTFAGVNASGLNPLWANRDVLQGVEGVPLDTFGTSAAHAAIVLFAWWGATALMLTVLGFTAVARYRAMIPLIYLLMAINHIARQLLADTAPITGTLGAGAAQPLIVIALLLVGLGLSLTVPRRREET